MVLTVMIGYILELAFVSGRTTGYWGRYIELYFSRNLAWPFETLFYFPSYCHCHLLKIQFFFFFCTISCPYSPPPPPPLPNQREFDQNFSFLQLFSNSFISVAIIWQTISAIFHCIWEFLLSLSDLIRHGDQTHAWHITQMLQQADHEVIKEKVHEMW